MPAIPPGSNAATVINHESVVTVLGSGQTAAATGLVGVLTPSLTLKPSTRLMPGGIPANPTTTVVVVSHTSTVTALYG